MPPSEAGQATGSSAPGARAPLASEGYKARRYAVKFNPPCIFLEYEDTAKKRRVRAVKLNGVQATVDPDRLTRKVIRSFPRKLEPTSVKYDQVRKLVLKLLEFLALGGDPSGTATPGADGRGSSPAGKEPPPPLRTSNDGTGSGTGTSPQVPRRSEQGVPGKGVATPPARRTSGSGVLDNIGSPMPALSPRPGDMRSPGGKLGGKGPYRGSVESNLSRFSTSTAGGSDDEDDLAAALDELNKELEAPASSSYSGHARPHVPAAGAGGSGAGAGPVSGGSSDMDSSRDSSFSFRDRPAGQGGAGPVPARPAAAAGVLDGPAGGHGPGPAGVGGMPPKPSRFAAEAEKLVIGLEVTPDMDLNKVTDIELKMAKAAMEEDFRRHQLKPGDPGYVYDKQEEFGPPTQDNDWDDSGDDAEPSEDPEVDWADITAAVSKNAGAISTPRERLSLAGGPPAGPDATQQGAAAAASSTPVDGGALTRAIRNARLESEDGGSVQGGGEGGKRGASPYNSNDWP